MLPYIISRGVGFDLIPPTLEAKTPLHQLNFRWRNQRQIRKTRRRAHAAGISAAFAGPLFGSYTRSRSKYRPHVGRKQIAKGKLAYTFD